MKSQFNYSLAFTQCFLEYHQSNFNLSLLCQNENRVNLPFDSSE